MLYNFKVNEMYKSRNGDGTYMYFKVLYMGDELVAIFIIRDDDGTIKLRSNITYEVEKQRLYLNDDHVSKLTDSEYLAMML